MIFVVNAGNRRVFEPDLVEMYRQRKKIFVDRMGWKLPVAVDMEIDRYDCDDTVYLLAKDRPDGEVRSSVRLLATEGPHLMSDLFAEACRNAPPRGPAIWEVSRFCTAPSIARRARLDLFWEITCGVIEFGLLYSVNQVVFAANRALLPLVLTCGWDARALGPTLSDGADEVTAIAAQVSIDALRAVRERRRCVAPALRSQPGANLRDLRSSTERILDRGSHGHGWEKHAACFRRELDCVRESNHG